MTKIKTMRALRPMLLLCATQALLACSSLDSYCDNREEKHTRSGMVMHQESSLDRRDKHSEVTEETNTYNESAELEAALQDASSAEGVFPFTFKNDSQIGILLPFPLKEGTFTIDSAPTPEEWSGQSQPSGPRGAIWEEWQTDILYVSGPGSTESDLRYATASGTIEVTSTSPLAFEFHLTGVDAWGQPVEAEGTFSSWEDDILDPEFQCDD